jgi:hypothetical protein
LWGSGLKRTESIAEGDWNVAPERVRVPYAKCEYGVAGVPE